MSAIMRKRNEKSQEGSKYFLKLNFIFIKVLSRNDLSQVILQGEIYLQMFVNN